MNYLPSKLVKLRKHYNYSQSYLAEVLGVDVLKYMGYENGNEMINYVQMKKLSSLYHISLIDIFKNSDDIPLYEIDRANTDEINIEYFTPKKTPLSFIKEKPILVGCLLGLILGVSIIGGFKYIKAKKPYEAHTDQFDKLALSQTSVVYIDSLGAVKGSGDNSNGQLSNLPSHSAIKVTEGEGFTVILNKDGSLSQSGLNLNYAEEIAKWKDIVDIAAGYNHIVGVDKNGKTYCTGGNTYNQCVLSDFDGVSNVYATPHGTIGIAENGKTYFAGDFIGTSLIRNNTNIKDLDSNINNLIILKNDGTCEYSASYDKSAYIKIAKWKNIVQVACGNDFFLGLKEDGTVNIAIDNYEIEEEVSKWKNIIAIGAGDDYLIGYDGKEIMGAGNNAYNQFNSGQSLKVTLPSVTNIKVYFEKGVIYVDFDSVKNASGYKVSIDVGTGVIKKAKDGETVKFEVNDEYKLGSIYKVSVVALGEGDFQDSSVATKDFLFDVDANMETSEKITIKGNLIGIPLETLKFYLDDIEIQYEVVEDETSLCDGSIQTVTELDGITPGSTYTRSLLDKTKVTVKACKIVDVPEGEPNGE